MREKTICADRNRLCLIAGFIIAVVAGRWCMAGGGNLFGSLDDAPDKPTVYAAQAKANGGCRFVPAAEIKPPGLKAKKLVVVTHGWLEKKNWCRDLAQAIGTKTDPNQWLCCYYDWRRQADVINPTDAAEYARDKAGGLLAREILSIQGDWQHIHLIGHSAGAWVISEAAKALASETKASIHITFLDAYVPPMWDQAKLGLSGGKCNSTYWAEHYLSRDITLSATGKTLTYAHNVDITAADPDISDHQFAWNWYLATVAGKYVKGQKYHRKRLFKRVLNTEYGFARGLEASVSKNGQLTLGNEPVVLTKPKRPVRVLLKKLFKHGQGKSAR